MPPNTIAPICPAAYALGLLPTLKKSVNKYAAAPNDSDGAKDLVSLVFPFESRPRVQLRRPVNSP